MSDELREPTFLLLTALAESPLHGYGLIQRIEALSEGRVRLRPGSLYGALDRLTREGLVSETGSEVVDGRHRRYYDLSPAGIVALTEQTERLRANARRAAAALRQRADSFEEGVA